MNVSLSLYSRLGQSGDDIHSGNFIGSEYNRILWLFLGLLRGIFPSASPLAITLEQTFQTHKHTPSVGRSEIDMNSYKKERQGLIYGFAYCYRVIDIISLAALSTGACGDVVLQHFKLFSLSNSVYASFSLSTR